MVVYVRDLYPTVRNSRVAVKILRQWPPHLNDGQRFHECLILVDEKGERIDAKIEVALYLETFHDKIKEGGWYVLSRFRVIKGLLSLRNSNNPFEIKFIDQTDMILIPPRSTDNFYHLIDSSMIQNFSPDEKNCCVDLCGMVLHVNEPPTIDFLDRQNGYTSSNQVVTFTVLDIIGEEIECVAVGGTSVEFIKEWEKITFSPTYRNEPVMCTLLFWRISVFEGIECLMSQIRCSKVILEDKIAGMKTGDLLHWPDDESSDEDCSEEACCSSNRK